MLTTIIKTHNCEDSISEVLESVKDLGEIFVVDQHSTDDTVLLAEEYRAKIIYSSLNEFNSAFNQVLSEAQNEWILLLEGDEIIPDILGGKILNYIENPKKNKNAVFLPTKLFYLDKEIKSARKIKLKLFKKESAALINNYSISLKPCKTRRYKLNYNFRNNKNCILKFEKRNICTALQNSINEAIIKAKEQNNHSASIFIKPFFRFIFAYFIKGAIFEGRRGFVYSFYKMVETFILECANFEKKVQNEQQ